AVARSGRPLLLVVERRGDPDAAEVRVMTPPAGRPSRFANTSLHPSHVLRVATYNIHKGVRGVGPSRRLEIHNLGLGIEALHTDVSDHRIAQGGLRHVPIDWNGVKVHGIVAHLGLMHSSRVRQVERIKAFIAREVPKNERLVLAGDFNDWGEKLDPAMRAMGLARATPDGDAPLRTFPSLVPVFSLDRIYTRGFRCTS